MIPTEWDLESIPELLRSMDLPGMFLGLRCLPPSMLLGSKGYGMSWMHVSHSFLILKKCLRNS